MYLSLCHRWGANTTLWYCGRYYYGIIQQVYVQLVKHNYLELIIGLKYNSSALFSSCI